MLISINEDKKAADYGIKGKGDDPKRGHIRPGINQVSDPNTK